MELDWGYYIVKAIYYKTILNQVYCYQIASGLNFDKTIVLIPKLFEIFTILESTFNSLKADSHDQVLLFSKRVNSKESN